MNENVTETGMPGTNLLRL